MLGSDNEKILFQPDFTCMMFAFQSFNADKTPSNLKNNAANLQNSL